MLPVREPFLFLLRAFAILIKAIRAVKTGGGVSPVPPRRDGDPLKQLAAYHLDIDGVFWSIRNDKYFMCSKPQESVKLPIHTLLAAKYHDFT